MLVLRVTGNMEQVLSALWAMTLLAGGRTIGCLLRQREVKEYAINKIHLS